MRGTLPRRPAFSLEDSPGLDLVAGVLVERGLPLNIHANEPVGHDYPGKGANTPGPCYEFARRHPDLTIVLAHLGGGLFVYELMAEVRRVLANVYYDTSAAPYLYGKDVYSVVAATAGPEKLLFGSDYPLLSPARYLRDTEGLEPTLRAAIFGGNAGSALGLVGAGSPAPGATTSGSPAAGDSTNPGAPALGAEAAAAGKDEA